MADRKHPPATDGLGTLCALIGDQRASLVRKVEGLRTAQAARSPGNPGWVVARLVEGTGRGAGYADILGEPLDGTAGR